MIALFEKRYISSMLRACKKDVFEEVLFLLHFNHILYSNDKYPFQCLHDRLVFFDLLILKNYS